MVGESKASEDVLLWTGEGGWDCGEDGCLGDEETSRRKDRGAVGHVKGAEVGDYVCFANFTSDGVL